MNSQKCDQIIKFTPKWDNKHPYPFHMGVSLPSPEFQGEELSMHAEHVTLKLSHEKPLSYKGLCRRTPY